MSWLASALMALTAAGLLAVAIALLRAAELRAERASERCYRLDFPRDLSPEALRSFLAGLSGLRTPWHRRWLDTPYVALESWADQDGISLYLLAPKKLVAVVAAHLRAAVPGVRLTHEPARPPAQTTTAAVLRLSTSRRPLRSESAAEASAAVLASLQPLKPGEALRLQWLLSPAGVPRPPRIATSKERSSSPERLLSGDAYELLPHAEALRAERAKQAWPLFRAVGRVGVLAGTTERRRHLLGRLQGAFQQLSAPGVRLFFRSYGWPTAEALYRRQVPLFEWPTLLNAAELAALLGWPVGGPSLPGLSLGGCRQLAPASDIPRAGCVVAEATFPGARRPLAIAPSDRLLHAHVIGPTGVGKSNLLLNLITQDMHAGRGVVVVDPKGDLVADCLARVPADRLGDVVVLDPADETRPVGLNLLDTTASSAELAAEQVVYVFHQLFKQFWGPRTDDILRAALLTLMRRPGMTLVEVPLLLTSKGFRSGLVAEVADDVIGLGPFWAWFESLKPNDVSQVIAPLMNKLRATLLRTRLRNCIGQAEPALRLEDVLAHGKLLFVPLRKGLLGEEAAALLGSLLVARLWQATLARTGLPPHHRRPVFAYIDEVQDYLNLPTSVGDMLAQARGLGLGLTLAHQHLGQLPTEQRRDLLANCRSKSIFQTTADDARALEKELRPYLTAEDLQGLGRFEVVAQLAVGQRVAPPATGRTYPPPEEAGQAQRAIARSRSRYGRDRDAIEAAMRARHEPASQASPVRRRPRRSA